MNEEPIWLTEDDVRASASLNEVIEALQLALVEEAEGRAANLDKAFATWDGKAMHALGSMMPHQGFVGFKTWAHTPAGGAAVFSLFAAQDGQLLAVMQAGGLGQMRTAAISGIASRHLARDDATDMALVGTGRQAMMQVAAVAATRRLTSLRVYSRTAERREDFVERAASTFRFPVTACATLEETVADAGIVTLITRGREPFLSAGMLARGTHLNAAGAILPTDAEFMPDVFDRTSVIAVDSVANARKGSREFIERFVAGPGNWADVQTLGQLLRDGAGRPEGADLTLFKPMGMGLSDLAVAALVYRRARANGTGTPMPQGVIAPPRWQQAA